MKKEEFTIQNNYISTTTEEKIFNVTRIIEKIINTTIKNISATA